MRFVHLFTSIFLVSSLFAASPQVAVWPVDSLIKVFQDDPPDKNRAPDQAWLIARNGHASVQFGVRPSGPVDALDVAVKLGGGILVQVRREGYVPVRANPPGSPAEECVRTAPARFPDPLLEDFPF